MTNGPITVDLVADSLPIDLVSRFTDAVSNVSGRATGKIVVRGTLKAPTLAGACTDYLALSANSLSTSVSNFTRLPLSSTLPCTS